MEREATRVIEVEVKDGVKIRAKLATSKRAERELSTSVKKD